MISTSHNLPGTYLSAKRFFFLIAGLSLIMAPTLSFIGWAIAHDTLTSFLNFNFSWQPTDATAHLDKNSGSEIFRYYLLPHYFIYASMPIYIGLSLALGYFQFRNAPWHSLSGMILSIIGAVYFIGVLGAFLSIPMGTVNVTNILKLSFALCILVFVGNIIQGFALYKDSFNPKWATVTFIIGNFLILIFPGVENWMALGSLLMLIGAFPVSVMLFSKAKN
jgi:hypothetical protein